MKKPFVFALALTALSAGSMMACGGSVENPSATQASAAGATKAPVAPQTHGAVKTVGEALGEVSLRPDQRSEIEQLASDAESRHAALTAGKKDLMLTFADQVEAGQIDRSALQAKTDALVATFEKNRPDDAAALTRLHAILDSDQRSDFVDALETKFKEKHGGGGRMHGLKQIAVDMKLSDAQQQQIKDAIKDSHDGTHMQRWSEGKKALEAFREDSFDANAVAPSQDIVRQRVSTMGTKVVAVAEKILPILSADQRKFGADRLRTFANTGVPLP